MGEGVASGESVGSSAALRAHSEEERCVTYILESIIQFTADAFIAGATYEWQYQAYPVGLASLTDTPPPPATTSIWTCQNGSTHTVETYIFDLELTHKIVELERQQAHVPVARAGAA